MCNPRFHIRLDVHIHPILGFPGWVLGPGRCAKDQISTTTRAALAIMGIKAPKLRPGYAWNRVVGTGCHIAFRPETLQQQESCLLLETVPTSRLRLTFDMDPLVRASTARCRIVVFLFQRDHDDQGTLLPTLYESCAAPLGAAALEKSLRNVE